MTVLPLSVGLTLTALIAARWRSVIRLAQTVGAGAALATVARTFIAGFDTTSTVALSLMHAVIAVGVVVALDAMAHRWLRRAEWSTPPRAREVIDD